jgi:putative FmdB family regulatory protein
LALSRHRADGPLRALSVSRDTVRQEVHVPLYEYNCSACRSRFEVLQRVGEGSEGHECPTCGSSEVEKEYSTFAGSVAGRASFSGGGCAPGGSRFT